MQDSNSSNEGLSVAPEERAADVSLLSFEFTGSAGEYFKIWIVNICLTILTLGLYSPWAKVRKLQYLYGSTRLDDTPFEYLADPVKILIGRLIVAAFFAVYSYMANVHPVTAFIFSLLYAALFPWVFIRALAFKLSNSSYRNIRLRFHARYGETLGLFFTLFLLTAITLGLAYPYFVHQRRSFVLQKSSYGTTRFMFRPVVGRFYGTYLIAVVIAIASGFLSFSLIFPIAEYKLLLMPLVYVVPYLLVFVYLRTAVTNLAWSNTRLGFGLPTIYFRSFMRYPAMVGIYVTNIIAIVFSLGLMIPWATIRTLRYRFTHFEAWTSGDLNSFVAGEQEQVSAAGEELGEFFDLDFGL